MVDHVLSGYFSCLFCYGQTGTGKTTTIMGKAEKRGGCGRKNPEIEETLKNVSVNKKRLAGSSRPVVHQAVCPQFLELRAVYAHQKGGVQLLNLHMQPQEMGLEDVCVYTCLMWQLPSYCSTILARGKQHLQQLPLTKNQTLFRWNLCRSRACCCGS